MLAGHDRNESLDLIRGLAILMVISIHTWQSVPGYFAVANDVTAFGPYGVQLFFIVSGYTMMLTFGSEVSRNSIVAFYIRRFFRIVPLFWAVALMYVLRKGFNANYFAPDGVSLTDMLLTFSLLQWLTPTSFNSVVPGGWSISVELQFYLVFPLFAWLFGKSRGRPAIVPYALIAAVYIAGEVAAKYYVLPAMYPHYPASQAYLVKLFCDYWLPHQLICFGFGFLLYQIVEQKLLPVAGFLMLAACSLESPVGRIVLFLFLTSYFVMSTGLRSPALAALGRHSYSIYLFHFDFATLPRRFPVGFQPPCEISIPVVVLLSYLLSRFVTKSFEDRFIDIGKSLSKRYSRSKAANPRAVETS
jgi:peptidoglycan/LPS O-acetylase OafA/YrhL